MDEYKFALTYRDETVPKGYIPIHAIFTQKKYALPGVDPERWCIPEKRLRYMRLSTYHEVKTRFELCKAEDYAKFWNGNLDAINDIGINHFANLTYFREIAAAMVCFQSTEKNRTNKNSRKMISWGIKDSIYRNYYKAQRDAIENGTEPKKVSLYDEHKGRCGNIFKMPSHRFCFESEVGNKQIVKVRKNAQFYQFEFWCKANGVSKSDGIYQAMAELIANHPVKDLKELGAYEKKCDLDYSEILIPDTTPNESVSTTVWVPKKIHMKMREIIEQFNLDVNNIGKPRMTIPTYVTQAIDELNKRSPLRYSDPKMYEKIKQAEEAKQYNEIMSEMDE